MSVAPLCPKCTEPHYGTSCEEAARARLAQYRTPPDQKMPQAVMPGPWVQTHLGNSVDLINPDPATIEPQDIAVSLSRVARFGGHTIEAFSVAQHSMLCLRIADDMHRQSLSPAERLAVLLHDAHEAYIGDITTPVAQVLDPHAITLLKHRLQAAIHRRFRLASPVVYSGLIEEPDRIALLTEKRDLMAPEPRPWAIDGEPWNGCVLDLGTRYWLSAEFGPTLRRLVEQVAQ